MVLYSTKEEILKMACFKLNNGKLAIIHSGEEWVPGPDNHLEEEIPLGAQ